jgi:hypothetical protein
MDHRSEAIDGGIIRQVTSAGSQAEDLDLPASLQGLDDAAILGGIADPIVGWGIQAQFPHTVVRADERGRDRIGAEGRTAEAS